MAEIIFPILYTFTTSPYNINKFSNNYILILAFTHSLSSYNNLLQFMASFDDWSQGTCPRIMQMNEYAFPILSITMSLLYIVVQFFGDLLQLAILIEYTHVSIYSNVLLKQNLSHTIIFCQHIWQIWNNLYLNFLGNKYFVLHWVLDDFPVVYNSSSRKIATVKILLWKIYDQLDREMRQRYCMDTSYHSKFLLHHRYLQK